MRHLRPKDKEVARKYIESGNATESVKAVHTHLTQTSAEVKASRLLNSDKFWQEINELSLSLGFGVDNAMSLLIKKASAGDKDSLKALQTWFEVTGNKAPTKTESKTENINISKEESDQIAKETRKYLGLTN